MKIAERIERAWTLHQLRELGRLPKWLDDTAICRAMEIESIARPTKIRRANQSRLHRVVGRCPDCSQVSQLGCRRCWNDLSYGSSDLGQRIGVLRAARSQDIIPPWLTDIALARAFRVNRYTVSLYFSESILCPNCVFPGNSRCLVCQIPANQVCL